MESASQLLTRQLEHRQRAIAHLVGDLSAEEAQMTLHSEGPSADWILLHLATAAHTTLLALGGSAPPVERAGLFPHSRGEFERIAAALLETVRGLTPEAWSNAPAIEVLPSFRDTLKTRADFLSGHIFHLAYHAGQLGSLRSKWGVTGS